MLCKYVQARACFRESLVAPNQKKEKKAKQNKTKQNKRYKIVNLISFSLFKNIVLALRLLIYLLSGLLA